MEDEEDEIAPDYSDLFGMIGRIRNARRKIREEMYLYGRQDAVRLFHFVNNFVGESPSSAVKRLKVLFGTEFFRVPPRKYDDCDE